MFFRKQYLSGDDENLWKQHQKHFKTKDPPLPNVVVITSHLRFVVFFLVGLSTWFLALTCFFRLQSQYPTKNIGDSGDHRLQQIAEESATACDGAVSVYVYDLPEKFNLGLLKDCQHLNIYTDMCPHVANFGLGQPLPSSSFTNSSAFDGAAASATWFATHQFLAEMIFHARVENHRCRTRDPSSAALFYVPFYGGLHASSKFREGNHTARDELAVQLAEFLESQPWFRRRRGGDHFLALGRTAWDFMRTDSGPDFGANSLMNLAAVKNMSVLTVERNPWHGSNQFGIPYPSYLHPYTPRQMQTWQLQMEGSRRPYLFSFIGGPRKGVEKAAVRDEMIRQCSVSFRCKLLKCSSDGSSKCHHPNEVLKIMSKSQFCLQAPGDSFTRRSTFDAVVAGCIPVFFSPHTAYTQYAWYLPQDAREYSVYIQGIDTGNGTRRKIEDELSKISSEEVERIRSLIIRKILPRITYVHPNATNAGFQDAVDVALATLTKHVQSKLERSAY